MAYIRTTALILSTGHGNIVPVRSAGNGFANLNANQIMAIMCYYHVKGHRQLNENFIQNIYEQL